MDVILLSGCYNRGYFREIKNNTIINANDGAGVYATTFTMSGGTMSGNIAHYSETSPHYKKESDYYIYKDNAGSQPGTCTHVNNGVWKNTEYNN